MSVVVRVAASYVRPTVPSLDPAKEDRSRVVFGLSPTTSTVITSGFSSVYGAGAPTATPRLR